MTHVSVAVLISLRLYTSRKDSQEISVSLDSGGSTFLLGFNIISVMKLMPNPIKGCSQCKERTRKPHDTTNLSPHSRSIAMNGTCPTGWLILLILTLFQSLMRIFQQGLAVRA